MWGTKSAIGVDIGNSCVKAIELEKSGSGYRVLRYYLGKRAYNESLSESVSKLIKGGGFKPGSKVVGSLDAKFASIKLLDIQAINPEQVETIVKCEIAPEFSTRGKTVSHFVFGKASDAQGQPVFPTLVVAANQDDINSLNNLFRDLNFPISGMDIDLVGCINALNLGQPGSGTVALVEGGSHTVNISVMKGGVLRNYAVLSERDKAGLFFIIDSVSRSLGMSFEQFEAKLAADGLPRSPARQGGSQESGESSSFAEIGSVETRDGVSALSEAFIDLFEKIFTQLDSFSASKLDRLLVAGGLGLVKNLPQFVDSALKKRMEIASIANVSSSIQPDQLPIFLVSIGLAIGGLE